MKLLRDFEGCKEYEKIVSRAVATENNLTFELQNESGFAISKWKIDDCVLKHSDGSKCDYLIIIEERKTCFWIELKDQDLDDACLQIYSSIKNIEGFSGYQHKARIVLGRFIEDRNRIESLRYTNFKKLINTIGGKQHLSYKTKVITEKI
ncbi:hypothetical protein [Parasediminibacterium sp. JCM 36343]|uniref:hypothetical protein n=1 Tax=Parasediminibacterium sp. JCM 36343 TaxID=3374279 RepID=UPI00397C4FE1